MKKLIGLCPFQLEKYLENEKNFRESKEINKERKNNKKGTKVHFNANYLLQDAIDNFDDREGTCEVTVIAISLNVLTLLMYM